MKAGASSHRKYLQNETVEKQLIGNDTSTYLQSCGVFLSPTITTFQPVIAANLFTSFVGAFIEVSTIHLSFMSSALGDGFRSIFVQSTSAVSCFPSSSDRQFNKDSSGNFVVVSRIPSNHCMSLSTLPKSATLREKM